MQKIIIATLFLLLFSCNNKSKEQQRKEIFAFKEMSDLATVEYTLSKVVKANDNATWYKLGKRKIIMSVMAYAKAGIDLSQIKDEQVVINNDGIIIQLPKAKLIYLNIPPEEIKEEMAATGLFRQGFDNNEKNELLIQAENSIRHSIDSLGILKKAEDNAQLFISNFVKRLGYKNVIITFEDIKATNPTIKKG
jgi:Protein of unknown function (DUF4230)